MSEPPDAELQQLADKLVNFASEFDELASVAIPCWIIDGELRQRPHHSDEYHDLCFYARIRRHEFAVHRAVWLYEDDFKSAEPVFEKLKMLGGFLSTLTDDVKAVAYHNWCPHCFTEGRHYIEQAIEVLFPAREPDLNHRYGGVQSTPIAAMTFFGAIGSRRELHSSNLALSAADAARQLAERLRKAPREVESPADEDFCCGVAREEDRVRKKRPEEMLPWASPL